MNADTIKRNRSCRVAGCGLRPKSPLQYAVGRILPQNATRNFHWFMFFALYLYSIYILYIYYYICIYIIYNIIKNKKKEPTHRVAHIYRRKKQNTTSVAGCVLVKIGSTVCCGKDFGRNPQFETLQLGCVLVLVSCCISVLCLPLHLPCF